MFGDVAPVKELVEVAHKHGAYALLDEAHSFRRFWRQWPRRLRAGRRSRCGRFLYTGTFSKSLASIGGFVASNHPELEYLRFSSRPYMFTASPSPANVAAASAALARLKNDQSMRKQLWENAASRLFSRFHPAWL